MKEKLCGVYCIENTVSNKKYIGISRDIKRRWIEHESQLRAHTHVNQYLQSSWDKHGESHFKFYVLELCNENLLSEKERYYIDIYKTLSHENGYNLTIGGENTSIGRLVIRLKDKVIYNFVYEAADKANVSTITMISWCRQKRNYMYLDEFDRLSEEEKEYWANFDWDYSDHARISKAHSRENISKKTREKLSVALSGENNPRAFSIYCPQLDESFGCARYASDKYGISSSGISQCINRKSKSAGKHPVTGEKLTWVKIKNDIVC